MLQVFDMLELLQLKLVSGALFAPRVPLGTLLFQALQELQHEFGRYEEALCQNNVKEREKIRGTWLSSRAAVGCGLKFNFAAIVMLRNWTFCSTKALRPSAMEFRRICMATRRVPAGPDWCANTSTAS